MKRGPKPKPTWRRELDGNPGKRPGNPHEPTPPAPEDAFDAPPEEIAGVPRAAAEWARLAPMLRKGRQITEADRAALIALCLEWARYLEAIAKVSQPGTLIVLSPNGYPMPNPYLAIATKALQGCTRLWPELGLTPSSRTRVQVPPGADDAFAEFDEAPPLLPPPPDTTTH
jgi:P27 family predicted phage terminase small subunit